MTTRHLITRTKEHLGKNGLIKKHGLECGVNVNGVEDLSLDILDRSNRGIVHLSILEALHIRETKPMLNTKDEYIGRTLRIRI